MGRQAAVALALYRKHDPMQNKENPDFTPAQGTGGNNYTVLAPPPDTELRVDDWIVALGSRRFGRGMHRLGLLRGSKPWKIWSLPLHTKMKMKSTYVGLLT